MKSGRISGFSLIELMTVVVVIAILAAVAYPSYQDHVRKGKRAEGKAALLKAAQVLERWYSDKNTYGTVPPPPASPPYTGAIDLVPLFPPAVLVVYSGENPADNKSSYTITAAAETGACPLLGCFALIATPNPPFVDTDCGNLTLGSTGVRGFTAAPTTTNTPKCKW